MIYRHDSAVVISSMVEGIYARVAAHSDIVDFAKDSTVPVSISQDDRAAHIDRT